MLFMSARHSLPRAFSLVKMPLTSYCVITIKRNWYDMDAWTHAQCSTALKANQRLHDRLSTAILMNFDHWLGQAETLADLRRALTCWLGSTSTESYVAPNYTDECRAALLRALPQPHWYAVWGQKTKCLRTRILLVNTVTTHRPDRAMLLVSQAATPTIGDLRKPPQAVTTSPAAFNFKTPSVSIVIAALISRSWMV